MDWMEPTEPEPTDDEVADEVELRILRSQAKFIPVRARWLDGFGVVLAEAKMTPRVGSIENTFYACDVAADRTGTFDHLLLIDAQGYEFKANVVMNTKSILVGARVDVEVTIKYE